MLVLLLLLQMLLRRLRLLVNGQMCGVCGAGRRRLHVSLGRRLLLVIVLAGAR